MPDPIQPGAVFLSYAREDAGAARRIAEALRSQGVEAWFDENELRGGDAWDAQIRRQIRECALFLPIISASTQARHEGYFRREWKLAVERTHDMSASRAFLVPVAIDDTPEAKADVPEAFLQVQWTRLPGALPTPRFLEQVKRLLAVPRTAAPSLAAAADGSAAPGKPTKSRIFRPAALFPPAVVTLIAVAIAALWLHRGRAGAAASSSATAASGVTDKSIAVLPFENMSPDQDNAYFCDGIQEDILTDLANIRELRVVSRTSVEQYRHSTKPLRQIAQELGVGWILEGSVQRAANTVRVTGQLINGRSDEHLWAKSYDRPLTDVFAIQSELAQTIAASLQTQLTPQERGAVEHQPTANLAAYDLYNRARALGNATFQPRQQIIELCGAAVQLDPAFAQAWAMEGLNRSVAQTSFAFRSPGNLAEAKTAVERASALNPNLPDVIAACSVYTAYGLGDLEGGIAKDEEGLAAYPNDADFHYGIASFRRRQGHWAESLAHMHECVRLDPANLYFGNMLAGLLEAGRRYTEAASERRRLLPLVPDRPAMEFGIARDAFLETGSTADIDAFFAERHTEADAVEIEKLRRSWEKSSGAASLPSSPGAAVKAEAEDSDAWSAFALAQARLGRGSQALESARKAVSLMAETADAWTGPGYSRRLADVYLLTGDRDKALAEYARLLRVPYGDLNVHEMRRDPKFAPLRSDPRFEALLDDPKNNAPLF